MVIKLQAGGGMPVPAPDMPPATFSPPLSPSPRPAPAAGRRSLLQAGAASSGPVFDYGTFSDSLLQNLTDAIRSDLGVRSPSFLIVGGAKPFNVTRVSASGAYSLEPAWNLPFFVTGFGADETAAAQFITAVNALQAAPLASQVTTALSRFGPTASVAAVASPVVNIDIRSAWLSFNPAGAAARDIAESPSFKQNLTDALSRNGFVLTGSLTVASPFPAPTVEAPTQLIYYDKNDRIGLAVGLVTGLTVLLLALFLAGYFLNNWLYARREARGELTRRKKPIEKETVYEVTGQQARIEALRRKEEYMQRCIEGGVMPAEKARSLALGALSPPPLHPATARHCGCLALPLTRRPRPLSPASLVFLAAGTPRRVLEQL